VSAYIEAILTESERQTKSKRNLQRFAFACSGYVELKPYEHWLKSTSDLNIPTKNAVKGIWRDKGFEKLMGLND